MKLRDATSSDIDTLLALERACYHPQQAYTREEYHYSLTRAKAVNILLEEGGVVKGFVGAFHHRTHKLGHIYTVNVDPKERGRGFGKKLMSACEARLAELGMKRVVLEVNVENTDAMRLYERCGYAQAKLLKNYYTNYRVNDAWLYQKPLPTTR